MDVHPTKNVSIGIDPYPFRNAAERFEPMMYLAGAIPASSTVRVIPIWNDDPQ